MVSPSGTAGFFRRHPVWIAVFSGLVVFCLLFEWDWLRHPLENYVSNKTQRTFRISHLDVDPGWTPVIRVRDLTFSNAEWGKAQPVFAVKEFEFSISLRDLLDEKILLPRVALTDADLFFERLGDNRRNWTLREPTDSAPSRFRIGSLSVNNGRLQYFDYGRQFELDVKAETFDPSVAGKVGDAAAKPDNSRYSTRYAFSGKYRDAAFSGDALTGEVLSFQQTGHLFPLKGNLVAGTTRLSVEGFVADVVNISGIDANLAISGKTLANLYPFLLLPLPASPPYSLRGHLALKGDRYTFDKFSGKIGSTDVYGDASYVKREPRPLLTADLHSKNLDLADLGPLVGVQTRVASGKPAVTQAETATRPKAVAAESARDPKDRILPAGKFEGGRLQAIDAEVTLESGRLRVPAPLPFESLRVALKLHDAVLKLEPLEFGFAGGKIVSQVTLDARKPLLKSDAKIEFRRLRLDQLFPESPTLAKAAGTLGARINLGGSGNSIADIAAKSNGTISAAVANGRISNLLDAISGLNGGKVVRLLVGGDKDIEVRCGGVAFDVRDGRGTSTLFLIDTEQTQITGDGGFNLENESFDMEISPKPKKPGIFSLRTPIHVYGTFSNPQFELEKTPLAARAGAALALAVINPFAALIPLIETGPGTEADCAALLDLEKKAG